MWSIVTVAHEEGRYELVLSGKEISTLIEQGGLDERIFNLKKLNFLEISVTSLDSISPKIANLSCLTQLCLTRNQLQSIPPDVGKLRSLHFLDLSFNKLSHLPPDMFAHLSELTNLILTGNNLQSLPSVQGLTSLHNLTASNNNLKELPTGLELLQYLAVLDLSKNELTAILDDLHQLASLKTMDLSDNKLVDFSPKFAQCRKLVSLKLHNNPFKDSRLRRIANDDKAHNALFAYLHRLADLADAKGGRVKGGGKSKRTTSQSGAAGDAPGLPRVIILRAREDENYNINQSATVKSGPRPYLLACTIHGVCFGDETKLKAFVLAQEKWHQDLGDMRRKATLATHDLRKIKFPLEYTLSEAQSFELHPLNRSKRSTGEEYLRKLINEATMDRKARKQCNFSKVYRYLDLLNLECISKDLKFVGMVQLPVLTDYSGVVISVPPLTNSHDTRITTDTQEMLLEVTGLYLDTCKVFAETVVEWLLDNSCFSTNSPLQTNCCTVDPTTEDDALVEQLDAQLKISNGVGNVPVNALVIRPIRVQDSDGNICVFFPSRTDLIKQCFNTVRS